MAKPLKILHVLGRLIRGGIQVRTVEIYRHIDRRRYQFQFCALSGRAGDLDDEVRGLGGRVHLLRERSPGMARRFQRLLRDEKIDVVHSHLHYGSGYVLRLAADHGTPVRVAHFRSSHDERATTLLRQTVRTVLSPFVPCFASDAVMRRWLDRYATNIVGVSRSALDLAWNDRWPGDPRCSVVYDGLNPREFAVSESRGDVRHELGVKHDESLYIHVGRMAEPKNHVRLVEIFAEILRRQPTARLMLVGRTTTGYDDNAIERRVRARLAELGIAGHVILAGERLDVSRLMKAADVLLFPSLWEGLGDVVLEACAAGTPSLTSDLPSIREIAQRLAGVELLPLSESNAVWADRACWLSRLRPSEEERAVALRHFAASEFTVDRCIERLCRIWQGDSVSAPQIARLRREHSRQPATQGGAHVG